MAEALPANAIDADLGRNPTGDALARDGYDTEGPHAHDDHGLSHVMPIPVLLGVFAALLVLTGCTVLVSVYDLGRLEIWVGLSIAIVKATLVATYFMHLRYDKLMNTILLVFSVIFLVLFLTLTLVDATAYNADIVPVQLPQ